MTSRTNVTCGVMLIVVSLASMACGRQAANNSANMNAAANAAVAAKRTEAAT